MDIKSILDEYGWASVLILILIQFLFGIWKDHSKEDRKVLKQIQYDVNVSFAFLRVMAGDKYDEYIRRINEENTLRNGPRNFRH